MADKCIRKYHHDMVEELSGLFATKDFIKIRSQMETLDHIKPADVDDIKSMDDLCKKLRAKKVIDYGKYDDLCEVLGPIHVDAEKIISRYTKLILKSSNNDVGSTGTFSGEIPMDTNGTPQAVVRGDTQRTMVTPESRTVASPESQRVVTPDISENRKRTFGNQDETYHGKRIKREEEDRSSLLRKEIDNTHDARIIDVWTRARNAIGHIRGPHYGGTGFRVGENYILTAYHVAEDITKQNKSDDADWCNLESKEAWIEFHFPKQSDIKKFHFEPDLIAGDKELDFAILQLKEATGIPEPIRKFGKPDESLPFALLGHPAKPNSEVMQFDPEVKLFHLPTDDRRKHMIEEDKNHPRKVKLKRGYEGILDDKKVLFDCWVQHGASGSPGIVMGNNDEEPICTLMLVKGFPSHAFGLNATHVPHEKMIEQGVKMEEIAKKVASLGRRLKTVKMNIFGEDFP